MHLELTRETKVRLARMFKPTMKTVKRMGLFLVQQVRERFQTAGKSGGVIWPEKVRKAWGADDGRAILTGQSAGLLGSFQWQGQVNSDGFEVSVFTPVPYAKVHQEGTQGKGGALPTIKPVKAKALFIPISERAMVTSRHEGGEAAYIRSGYGMAPTTSPIRMATRGKKIEKGEGAGLFKPLKAGKLEDGRLWKRDRYGDWVVGTPDFIFLSKVDIPPRPMLPNGRQEKSDQADMILESLTA